MKTHWVEQVRVVEKPWGHEEWFALVPGLYCGKTLHINAGHSLSLQFHRFKEETISLQSGRLLLQLGASEKELDEFELLPGEAVHIKPEMRHRMTALESCIVLEASTTQLDDVVRLEDRYGRTPGEQTAAQE